MADLSNLSDFEQVEIVKKWLKNNGISVIVGIALGLGGIIAWNSYQDYETSAKNQVSDEYFVSFNQPDKQNAFITKYPDSIYASDLALLVANTNVEKGESEKALKILNWLLTKGKTINHKILAAINIAKIQLGQKQTDLAIDTLNGVKDYKKFKAEANMVLGDAFSQKGNKEKAKQVYEQAILDFGDNSVLKNIIQLKLHNL